ncbi:MAG: GNAT family N-acetyltransferase [Thermoplasmata archaeon]|nr:GNAT family N-acetyltransferase [Thermoplasmata archaeon]
MELILKESMDDIRGLRSDHLDHLCQPQELYLEIILKDSVPYVFRYNGLDIGYALLGDGKALFEFHIIERYLPMAQEAFQKALKDLQVETAFCQSFDHLCLSMCMIYMKKRKIVGFHFRDRIDHPLFERDEVINERTATIEDLDLLTRYRDGIYDDDEVKDIPYWIGKGTTVIFEGEGGNFIGYGMYNRAVHDRNWYDIGMYVKPDLREKGYGVYMISRMDEYVTSLGGLSTAGCEPDNIGSKRTLEKAGFASKHVLIEFEM